MSSNVLESKIYRLLELPNKDARAALQRLASEVAQHGETDYGLPRETLPYWIGFTLFHLPNLTEKDAIEADIWFRKALETKQTNWMAGYHRALAFYYCGCHSECLNRILQMSWPDELEPHIEWRLYKLHEISLCCRIRSNISIDVGDEIEWIFSKYIPDDTEWPLPDELLTTLIATAATPEASNSKAFQSTARCFIDSSKTSIRDSGFLQDLVALEKLCSGSHS